MINIQPAEKLAPTGASLDVQSVFYTIQGEGPFCGTPAVFIRLAGCNLQCPNCDTDYTSARRMYDAHELVARVRSLHRAQGPALVVITGGEPLRQSIQLLVLLLINDGFYVQIETNGTLPLHHALSHVVSKDLNRRNGLYIVCSPKTGQVQVSIAATAVAYKYIVAAGSTLEDGLPSRALDHMAAPRLARPPAGFAGLVYVQPEDAQDRDVNARHLAEAVASCMTHGYILQLQIHKLIGVE